MFEATRAVRLFGKASHLADKGEPAEANQLLERALRLLDRLPPTRDGQWRTTKLLCLQAMGANALALRNEQQAVDVLRRWVAFWDDTVQRMPYYGRIEIARESERWVRSTLKTLSVE